MTPETQRGLPWFYDGTQFIVYLNIPSERYTTAELYEHVYGVRLDDGAKPWPYYQDARTKEWWSLSTPTQVRVDALFWMIELKQLAYKSRSQAEAFLESVLSELAVRARALGGTAEPECSVSAALAKMDRAMQWLKIRDYQVKIVVTAPEGRPCRVAEWWQALESVGLKLGDGDLFWMYNEAFTEDGPEPYELFCAEPDLVPGYFHPGDRNGAVTFPDVALHFRAKDVTDAVDVLHRMADVAQQLTQKLGATLLTGERQPFDLPAAEKEVKQALQDQQSLQLVA